MFSSNAYHTNHTGDFLSKYIPTYGHHDHWSKFFPGNKSEWGYPKLVCARRTRILETHPSYTYVLMIGPGRGYLYSILYYGVCPIIYRISTNFLLIILIELCLLCYPSCFSMVHYSSRISILWDFTIPHFLISCGHCGLVLNGGAFTCYFGERKNQVKI